MQFQQSSSVLQALPCRGRLRDGGLPNGQTWGSWQSDGDGVVRFVLWWGRRRIDHDVCVAVHFRRRSLEFGPVEYFGLAIFGLSVIISISGRSLIKGMMAGFFGLLISAIGFDPISGYPRFTFGMVEMMEKAAFHPYLIGLFAVSEVFNRSAENGTDPASESQA